MINGCQVEDFSEASVITVIKADNVTNSLSDVWITAVMELHPPAVQTLRINQSDAFGVIHNAEILGTRWTLFSNTQTNIIFAIYSKYKHNKTLLALIGLLKKK